MRKLVETRVVGCSDYEGCVFLVLSFGCQSLSAVPSTVGTKLWHS